MYLFVFFREKFDCVLICVADCIHHGDAPWILEGVTFIAKAILWLIFLNLFTTYASIQWMITSQKMKKKGKKDDSCPIFNILKDDNYPVFNILW